MRWPAKQLLFWFGGLAFIIASTLLLRNVWKEQGLRAVQSVNAQRVELAATALVAEINRQDHLPLLLSLDADVRAALSSPPDRSRLEELDRKLQRVSLEADTRAIYVARADGMVVASDDWGSPNPIIGTNIADRPYFQHARDGGKSTDLGVDPQTGRVRYFLAEAVRAETVLGVVIVRVEFDILESTWERAGEHIVVTDKSDVAFLASDSIYRYRSMAGKPEADGPAGLPEYYRGEQAPILSALPETRGKASIVHASGPEGTSFLYEALPLPEYGWTVHRLADLTSVNTDARDGAIIGAAISTLIVVLLLYMIQRHQAYVAAREAGRRLTQEVAERTRELREANSSLRIEVDERRRTEARLWATQNELVQAGKLAALGQMSATLAHEINQPLAAIQTFIASAKVFTKRGDTSQLKRNLDLISNLAERMAKLTAHLKTFAGKSEPGHPERVQVDRAVEGALFLVESRVKSGEVQIDKEIERNLITSGHAVQLEQVLVNLLLNALDAVAPVSQPMIQVSVRAMSDIIAITVADNGPGIAPDMIERIFDPFVTTKPVGKGLGLGLSISYGIVQNFHGRIYAVNRPEGGAQVTVELPRLVEHATAMVKSSHV